jgi:nucleoside-diphosphate-sugar epimerase
VAKKMKVLVTGGSGLLGRNVVPLLKQFCEVKQYDMHEPEDPETVWIRGDVRDPFRVADAMEGMDAVVHMAGLHGPHWKAAGDMETFEVNVSGTKNVVLSAAQAGVDRLVFTSSQAAYGNRGEAPYLPLDEEAEPGADDLYGLTNVLSEDICSYATRTYGMSTFCLRCGLLVSSHVPPQKRGALLCGAVDVRDAALAHAMALQAPRKAVHEVLNIAADTPFHQAEPEEAAMDPESVLDELMPGTAELIEQDRFSIPRPFRYYSIEKACETLGWKPEHSFSLDFYHTPAKA